MGRTRGDQRIALRIFLEGVAATRWEVRAQPAAGKPPAAFLSAANRRRTIAQWLRAALLLSPTAWVVRAQPVAATKTFRIGWLSGTSGAEYGAYLDSFRAGLRAAGFSEGRHYLLLMRYAEGQLERLEALATDLVSQNVDLIVATTPSTLAAARRATSTSHRDGVRARSGRDRSRLQLGQTRWQRHWADIAQRGLERKAASAAAADRAEPHARCRSLESRQSMARDRSRTTPINCGFESNRRNAGTRTRRLRRCVCLHSTTTCRCTAVFVGSHDVHLSEAIGRAGDSGAVA